MAGDLDDKVNHLLVEGMGGWWLGGGRVPWDWEWCILFIAPECSP